MRRSLARVSMALLALAPFAVPAEAEIFFVTLNNDTVIETAYQPQEASWDRGMVLLLTETGNWIGVVKSDIKDVRSEDQIAGYGVAIDSNTFELGFAPNDATDPNAEKPEGADARVQMLEQMLNQQQMQIDQRREQQNYSIQQFVDPGQTQGITSRFIGNPSQPVTGSGNNQ